jgi:hypothetical protein
MSRLFTLGEATKLLPRVASKIHDAVREKREYAEADLRFRAGVERITMMGGTFVNTEQSHGIRSRRDTSLGRLKETLEGIQELGVLVKDLDVGLIDFPTLYRGQEVYLCWKMGENGIEWWHGVEEGFRGRKPIDADFIANHSGGEKEDD